MFLSALHMEKILSPLENKGVFDDLEKLYAQMPETECEGCATCCTAPPPGYLIEFLNLYRYLKRNLAAERASIMVKLADYYFLELVDINVKCPFMSGDNKCLVYPVRSLSCRFYGLQNREEAFDHTAMQKLAQFYRERHGIELPPEIVSFHLPPNCARVRVARGKHLKKGDIERLITELAGLEAHVMPPEYIEQDRSLLPFASYLALTVLGEGARSRRIRVMKEYLETGRSELLEGYREKAKEFNF